jgi:FG-GAP-like repeat/Fibronectin type III domain
MKTTSVLLGLALTAVPVLAQTTQHAFRAPTTWANEFSRQQGWDEEDPRMLADVDGDGDQDVVGFGIAGVYVGWSVPGNRFTAEFMLEEFGHELGWRADKHIRTVARLNHDAQADIVGFGDAGVYRALSTGHGFAPVGEAVLEHFGYELGWRVDKHVRLLADVSGDGLDDIVAFGDAGVYLALADGSGGFEPPVFQAEFGFDQGWFSSRHVRTMADVNGDGRQDIVGFGEYEVWIALSTGTGFAAPQGGVEGFAYQQGWRVGRHRRLVMDINHDGKADIIGFGEEAVYTARSHGDGFDAPVAALNHLGSAQGFVEPRNWRFAADLNGDGYPELVGIGDEAVIRSLGGPSGFTSPRAILRAFALGAGYSAYDYRSMPRMIGDVDGDGYQDLVAFGASTLEVARSRPEAPPLPPPAPTNPRITGATPETLDLAWNDNSFDERRFYLRWQKAGSSFRSEALAANTASHTLTSLAWDSEYCFSVQAESLWGISAWSPSACGRTEFPATGTHPVVLIRPAGTASYHGSWELASRRPVRLWRDPFSGTAQIFFVRPGHTPLECFGPTHPQATVALPPNGSLGPIQIEQVLGGPAVPGAPVDFLACAFDGGTLPNAVSFNLDWAP